MDEAEYEAFASAAHRHALESIDRVHQAYGLDRATGFTYDAYLAYLRAG